MGGQDDVEYWHTFDMYVDATRNLVRTDEDREHFRGYLVRQTLEKADEVMDRRAKLPNILVKVEKTDRYLPLLQEARQLFEQGFFYSCVVMSAVTAERILKDLFASTVRIFTGGQTREPDEAVKKCLESFYANGIREFLKQAGATDSELDKSFEGLIRLRNKYVHANLPSLNPESDALKAVEYLDQIVEGTVSVFRHYDIRGGKLIPKEPKSKSD